MTFRPCAAKTRSLAVPALLVAALAFAGPAHADGQPAAAAIAAGKTIAENGSPKGAAACAGCHGSNGEGQADAGIPRLAGLDRAYLARQLSVFASGERENPVMSPMAKMLDPTAMADLAAYYASLPVTETAASDGSSAQPASVQAKQQITLGATLASRGDWAHKIPACASCHAADGLGVGSAFPPLTGQSAAYITAQLKAWQGGTRHDDPLALMRTVAARLSDEQIAAVAAYYGSRPAARTVAGSASASSSAADAKGQLP